MADWRTFPNIRTAKVNLTVLYISWEKLAKTFSSALRSNITPLQFLMSSCDPSENKSKQNNLSTTRILMVSSDLGKRTSIVGFLGEAGGCRHGARNVLLRFPAQESFAPLAWHCLHCCLRETIASYAGPLSSSLAPGHTAVVLWHVLAWKTTGHTFFFLQNLQSESSKKLGLQQPLHPYCYSFTPVKQVT